MPGYATISRQEAGKQQNEIKPPRSTPEVPEAPKSAAPGSHPSCPVESDMEAVAAYQGADLLITRPADTGSWHLNAWNQPVFVPGPGAQESGASRGRDDMLALPEERQPPGQRSQEQQPKAEEKPAPGRRGQ